MNRSTPPVSFPESIDRRSTWKVASLLVLLVGAVIQVLLSTRAWIGGDQILLLDLGWDFAATGRLQPFAKMMTGAGANPGSLLQLLIGVPLAIWPWHQAPLVVIGLFDIAAVLLLYHVFRSSLGDRLAFFFLVLYWLSPWRLYHSGFLWEPQYLFLPAALHLWACWRQREHAAIVPSAVLAASLLLAMQLHNSFFLLVVLTLLLLFRKQVKLNLAGILIGLLIGALPLIPTMLAVVSGGLPAARESEGFIGRSLLQVAPVLKGVLYWFRLGSLDIGNPLTQTVFLEKTWAEQHALGDAIRIATRALHILVFLTIGFSVRASWWLFRPLWGRERTNRVPAGISSWSPEGEWMRQYALWCFVALVISAALSPITLQGWQVIIALHAATIPVAMWVEHHWTNRSSRVRNCLVGVVLLQMILIAVIGVGNNIFRRGPIPEEVYRDKPELLNILPTDDGRSTRVPTK